MQEYVVCFAVPIFCRRRNDEILVVEKQKPAWQKGRLNLVGGKVESGEEPMPAALRELKEESGYDAYPSPMNRVVGQILGVNCVVHCCTAYVEGDEPVQQAPGEIENVFWVPWPDLRDDPRIMPNLKVIIPLMLAHVDGWKITDQCCSGMYGGREVHDIGVQLEIPMPFTNADK